MPDTLPQTPTPTQTVPPAPGASPAYDRLIDALNRLPRPMMTLGTVLVFGYAMADPAGFAARMRGLEQMPDALWWLLGGVISFYFGAREAHYFRQSQQAQGQQPRPQPATPEAAAPPPDLAALSAPNAALADWAARAH